MHESPFLFIPLCRRVPCTKGTYCIACLLMLQLDCPLYTCGQRQNPRIAERMSCAECSMIFNVYCFERGKYAQCSECQQFRNFMLVKSPIGKVELCVLHHLTCCVIS
jgi:hypothetical protein